MTTGDLAQRAERIAGTMRRAEGIVAELHAQRARIIAEMADAGWGPAEAARALGVTRQRAHVLLRAARESDGAGV